MMVLGPKHVGAYFQFFTVHIVNIHNNHQHMHTFSFDTIKTLIC